MKIMSRLRRRGGFTLTEMIVSIAIFAVVSLALGVVIIHSIRGWSAGTSRAYADSAASLVVHKMWQDVREGSSATVTSGELSVTIPTLITDAHGEQYYDTSSAGATHRYYLSNGKLYRQIGNATATVYAYDIASVTFSAAGGTVTVVVTSRNKVGMSQSEEECTTQIVLRNFRS